MDSASHEFDDIDSIDDTDSITHSTPPNIFERFLVNLFEDRRLTPGLRPAAEASPQTYTAGPRVPFTPVSRILGSIRQTLGGRSPGSEERLAARTPGQPGDAHMSGPAENVFFCIEDTVGLKDDRASVGIVDRSFGDVDSHAPQPQRDYAIAIEKHEDISSSEFREFMRSGVPPRGTALITWHTHHRTELIPEARLQLLDRSLAVGDIVKRNASDPMSGTVLGTRTVCTLVSTTIFQGGNTLQAISNHQPIHSVPAEELINVHEFVEGALVILGDWVGRIDQVFDEVAVKLSNNSVVVVEDPDDLAHDDVIMLDRLSVGDFVKTKKGNLRRGQWRYGAFDPNVKPEGNIVETRPLFLDVQWLTHRMDADNAQEEPPNRLYRDEFDSPNFHVYDASPSAQSSLPLSADGLTPSYHVADLILGDRVRFKDLAGAALKYDGSRARSNGAAQGKITRIARTETLGYDMNVYAVVQTFTQATVQWQDLSVSEHHSTTLLPDPNVEDDDEVWPGELVMTKEEQVTAGELEWVRTPKKVGIVQSVRSGDRLAQVRWFEKPIVQFLEYDLIPPFETGTLCPEAEDVSLYDIRATRSLTRRRGDFVLVHPPSSEKQELPVSMQGPSWFGEVIDLGLDGRATVRLGAAKPVVEVKVANEYMTLAYSHETEMVVGPMDGDSSEDDYDDDEDMSFNDLVAEETWVEYDDMDGEVARGNEEDWSTEEEEDPEDEDATMQSVGEEVGHGEHANGTASLQRTTSAMDGVEHTPAPEDRPAIPSAPSSPSSQEELCPSFKIIDDPPPSNHHYLSNHATHSPNFLRRIAKEHKILRTSLPPNIFVRAFASRLELLRVLLIGPADTPYEHAPFLIDIHLPSSYPRDPPEAYFHSWTDGSGPVNPNLYEDGKICLSLLGTWHAGARNESWNPLKSTLLQVLVSIMGLVLVREPYYNEAGYDVHRSSPETKLASAIYSERTYLRSRSFIHYALTHVHDVAPFQTELSWLFRSRAEGAPNFLGKAIEACRDILERSSNEDGEGEGLETQERDGLRKVSRGAIGPLRRELVKLEALA